MRPLIDECLKDEMFGESENCNKDLEMNHKRMISIVVDGAMDIRLGEIVCTFPR
jgi:hypothetical protein